MSLSAQIEPLFSELIEAQRSKLLRYGREVIPTLTTDDLLQPNDYPELECHPLFRYEEGILAGLLTAQMALRALYSQVAHRQIPRD